MGEPLRCPTRFSLSHELIWPTARRGATRAKLLERLALEQAPSRYIFSTSPHSQLLLPDSFRCVPIILMVPQDVKRHVPGIDRSKAPREGSASRRPRGLTSNQLAWSRSHHGPSDHGRFRCCPHQTQCSNQGGASRSGNNVVVS